MSEIDRIVDQLNRAHDGDPWHGSPITTNLRGVTAAQAAARPPADAHSIWELVLHATAWRNEVRHRLTGQFSREPVEGDWPVVGVPSEGRWRAALRGLDDAHAELVKVVKGLSEKRLFEPAVDQRNPAAGTGVTLYELLHGIVQHDAYHSGQIAIVKKFVNAKC